MLFHAQRAQPTIPKKQNRSQAHGKLLSLPDEKFLARHKKTKLQSVARTMSKAEAMKQMELSVRTQAARDRHRQTVKRVKTKVWLDIFRPQGTALGLSSQSIVPQIVVTTPQGETRWLEDPNNYE